MTTKILSHSILTLFFATTLCVSRAQDAPRDKPPTPRLIPAPSTCSWEILYKYKQADPFPKTSNPVNQMINDRLRKQNPRLVSVDAIRAGDKRKEVLHYADESETARWLVGDFVLNILRPDHRVVTGKAIQPDVNYKEDFVDLKWINSAAYQGRQTFQGDDCYVYHQAGSETKPEMTAYINVKTGLPEAVETPDATATYSFTPSTDPLDVPKDVDQQIRAFQQTLIPKSV